MAKIMILLLLLSSVALVVADQAAAAATQLSPAAQKFIDDIGSGTEKLTNDIASNTPPAKEKETLLAILKHIKPLTVALDKAKESGDEKKLARIALTVQVAIVLVKDAPPEKKLKIMEDSFNSLAAPDPEDCPTVDKAYCEMQLQVQKAVNGVTAAAPADKMTEAQAVILKKTLFTVGATIRKAYANGDKKKIAQLLDAYTKAADVVIVAAPADKLKVMEKTFSSIAASGN